MRLLFDVEPRPPEFGLAVDEALLDSVRHGGEDVVRFWISERAVVIGRSQAIASECDLEALERWRIPVLRRISGGGAVYHYPGNLNVSMVLESSRWLGSAEAGFERFARAMACGLSELDAAAEPDDRMLTVRNRKVSGAAQARRGDATLIHATLLVQPDTLPMESLLRALRPGYRPAGTASRPCPTASLSELLGHSVDLRAAARAIMRGLSEELDLELEDAALTQAEAARAAELEAAKYRSREWNESHKTSSN